MGSALEARVGLWNVYSKIITLTEETRKKRAEIVSPLIWQREITKRDATQKEKTVLKRTTGISRRITLSSGEMMNPSRTPQTSRTCLSEQNIKICLLYENNNFSNFLFFFVPSIVYFLLSLLNSTPQHSTGILLFGTLLRLHAISRLLSSLALQRKPFHHYTPEWSLRIHTPIRKHSK